MTTQTADRIQKVVDAPLFTVLTFGNVDGKFTKIRERKFPIDKPGAVVMDKDGDRHSVHVHHGQVMIMPTDAVTENIRPVGEINTHGQSDWVSMQPGVGATVK